MRRGRPPLADPRDERLNLRLTKAERTALRLYAASVGISETTAARHFVVSQLARIDAAIRRTGPMMPSAPMDAPIYEAPINQQVPSFSEASARFMRHRGGTDKSAGACGPQTAHTTAGPGPQKIQPPKGKAWKAEKTAKSEER